jgi:hypothetical protein
MFKKLTNNMLKKLTPKEDNALNQMLFHICCGLSHVILYVDRVNGWSGRPPAEGHISLDLQSRHHKVHTKWHSLAAFARQ